MLQEFIDHFRCLTTPCPPPLLLLLPPHPRAAFWYHANRTNAQRFNVAVTRSKALTVVVGHAAVLAADRYWHELLQYCIEHHMYRGMPCPLLQVDEELDHRDMFDKALGASLGSFEQMFPQSLDDYYFLDDPGWKVM